MKSVKVDVTERLILIYPGNCAACFKKTYMLFASGYLCFKCLLDWYVNVSRMDVSYEKSVGKCLPGKYGAMIDYLIDKCGYGRDVVAAMDLGDGFYIYAPLKELNKLFFPLYIRGDDPNTLEEPIYPLLKFKDKFQNPFDVSLESLSSHEFECLKSPPMKQINSSSSTVSLPPVEEANGQQKDRLDDV